MGGVAGHVRRIRKTATRDNHAATAGVELQRSSSLAPAPLCHQRRQPKFHVARCDSARRHCTCAWTKTQTRECTPARCPKNRRRQRPPELKGNDAATAHAAHRPDPRLQTISRDAGSRAGAGDARACERRHKPRELNNAGGP